MGVLGRVWVGGIVDWAINGCNLYLTLSDWVENGLVKFGLDLTH